MSKITLYHNTSNVNAISISKEGIKGGMRLNAYGEGSEAEGAGIWCTITRGYGYGGATITFQIDDSERELRQQNDTEYIVYRDIKPEEITDIDLVISDIPCSYKRKDSINSTVESDIPDAINQWGKDKLLEVFKKNPQHFAEPYNYEQLVHLIETGNKYCKGTIKVTESKKVQESSIPKKYQHLIDGDIYKGADGYWVIDLKDGYSTSYGTNYIWAKTKRDALAELDDITPDRTEKVEENLQDQCQYIRTFEKEDPKYKDKIQNIEYSTTKKGEPKLEFTVNDHKVLVLEYPKTKKFYYYVDNQRCGYESSVINIVDNLLKEKKTESKHKLEEVSRNELLAKAKAETITRYNKSASYKGFSLVDIDTTSIKTRDALVITNKVGKYYDTIELEDILYWVGLEVDEARDKKMTLEVVRRALLGAMDGMDIKVDCECGDFVYRFAYNATEWGFKYGKPETRPAKIRNPDGYGTMCKHLIALLSNKSWVKQVASTLQQWIVDEIEWVRSFLKVEEEDFQLPDEYARYLGRHGAMKKFWDKQPDDSTDEDNEENSEEEVSDSIEDSPETTENDETTNDTPEEKPTLDNQSNMPKAFRKDNEDELEEK